MRKETSSTSRRGRAVTELLEWMLDTDPALRWRVERDLAHAPEPTWQATRARVATEGMGARLLALQGADGQWAGGAFFPEGFTGDEAQPWTATTWSLNSLREWGVDASVLEGTAGKLAVSSRWEYNDEPYWNGEVDACINGYALANGVWLGADVEGLVTWFLEHQMAEGGWNCEWVEGSVRSSIVSTLNSLTSILYFEQETGDARLRDARHAGEEYLLERGLMRFETTGEVIAPWVTRLEYPFRGHYNVLKGVDYFRSAALHDGVTADPRLAEAVDVIRAARQPDGTWLQQRRHPGAVWFDEDVDAGQPSPWLTFYGTRVLEWADAS